MFAKLALRVMRVSNFSVRLHLFLGHVMDCYLFTSVVSVV